MSGKPSIWTQNKVELLKKLYPIETKENLCNTFALPWSSIKDKACALKIKMSKYTPSANFQKLLDFQEPRAAMYLGMLLADGHFSRKDSITLSLHQRDKDYLNHYKDYFDFSSLITLVKNRQDYYLIATDHNLVPLIREKFDIQFQKTYNPPSLSWIREYNPDLYFAMIVGFIDGDGWISHDHRNHHFRIGTRVHRSWLNNLIEFQNFLYEYFNIFPTKQKRPPHIIEPCYSNMSLYDQDLLIAVKNKIIEFDLYPYVLQRKWDKIILSHDNQSIQLTS